MACITGRDRGEGGRPGVFERRAGPGRQAQLPVLGALARPGLVSS